mmetsp:Transcript_23738/g.48571  ORF Transcript_23738/g.48571 Transcript_23738/m.48571 type:complete len:350 (-) Transcript_23738:1420-2469(-)
MALRFESPPAFASLRRSAVSSSLLFKSAFCLASKDFNFRSRTDNSSTVFLASSLESLSSLIFCSDFSSAFLTSSNAASLASPSVLAFASAALSRARASFSASVSSPMDSWISFSRRFAAEMAASRSLRRTLESPASTKRTFLSSSNSAFLFSSVDSVSRRVLLKQAISSRDDSSSISAPFASARAMSRSLVNFSIAASEAARVALTLSTSAQRSFLSFLLASMAATSVAALDSLSLALASSDRAAPNLSSSSRAFCAVATRVSCSCIFAAVNDVCRSVLFSAATSSSRSLSSTDSSKLSWSFFIFAAIVAVSSWATERAVCIAFFSFAAFDSSLDTDGGNAVRAATNAS